MPKVCLSKFYNDDNLFLIAIARKGGVDINSFSLSSSSGNNELKSINLKYNASDLDSIIYSIEIIPIDIENHNYLLITVSNNGLSFTIMNLSKLENVFNNNPIDTKIINLGRRTIFPSIATIKYLSKHNCILVSMDNDIYLSSLLNECYSIDKDNNKFIFDESKLSFKSGSKLNIIYDCGRKPYHTFQPELCSIIDSFEIPNSDKINTVALIIKSDYTALMNIRWCHINESLDQISIKWELDLGSDIVIACIPETSYDIPMLYVACKNFIYVCSEIGILSKISCSNISYGNICGLLSIDISSDNNHNILLSTSSGLYIQCSFIIPSPNEIISNSIQNGSMDGGKDLPINKNVRNLNIEVICGYISNNTFIFDNQVPFLPYCNVMIPLISNSIISTHVCFMGYHDCYGIQLLYSTLEGNNNNNNNINNKIDFIPFICDNILSCDKIYGIDKTMILKDSKEDNNYPESMLVICSDESLGRSVLYRCEMETCVKTSYKCELDLDNNESNYYGLKLFSVLINNDNKEMNLILISSRVNNQSSLLLSSYNGISTYENSSQLFIDNEYTIGFFSLNKNIQIQITPHSINFININSYSKLNVSNNIYKDIISSTTKLTPIDTEVSNLSIIHASSCGIYIIIVIENTNIITILTSPNDELTNIDNIIKSTIIKGTFNIYSPSTISSINSYSWIGHHQSIMKSIVAISTWNSDIIEIREISELGGSNLKFDTCLNLKIPSNNNITKSVFQNIYFFPFQLEDKNKDIQIIDCICTSLDGIIIIFRLINSVKNLNNPWSYSIIKNMIIEDSIIGIEKLYSNCNAKISSENGFYINCINCDYLLLCSCNDENKDIKWRLSSIATTRKCLRTQIASISSNSIPNSNINNDKCILWLESMYDNEKSNLNNTTMLCFGFIDTNNKSRVQVGVSITGLVNDFLIDKFNRNKLIISWFELENILNISSLKSGICVLDSITLQCLWNYSIVSSNLNKLIGVNECLSHSRFNHETSNILNLAILTVSDIDNNSNVTIVQLVNDDIDDILVKSKELRLNIIGNKLINEKIISYTPLLLNNKSLLAVTTSSRLLIIGWIEEITMNNEITLSINVLSSISFHFSHIIEIKSINNNNRNYKYLDITNKNNSDFLIVSIIDVGIEILRVNSNYIDEIELKRERSIASKNSILTDMNILQEINDNININSFQMACFERIEGKILIYSFNTYTDEYSLSLTATSLSEGLIVKEKELNKPVNVNLLSSFVNIVKLFKNPNNNELILLNIDDICKIHNVNVL